MLPCFQTDLLLLIFLRLPLSFGSHASFPNGDPELTLFPNGWISAQTAWLPPKISTPRYVEDATPVRNQSTMFNNYMIGIGGTCSVYDPVRDACIAREFSDTSNLFLHPLIYSPHLTGAASILPVEVPFSFGSRRVSSIRRRCCPTLHTHRASERMCTCGALPTGQTGKPLACWNCAIVTPRMFDVDNYDPSGEVISWTKGGFQVRCCH